MLVTKPWAQSTVVMLKKSENVRINAIAKHGYTLRYSIGDNKLF